MHIRRFFVWLWLLVLPALVLVTNSAQAAEPLSQSMRESMRYDPRAVIEVRDACKKASATKMAADGESELEQVLRAIQLRHLQRLRTNRVQRFPSGTSPPPVEALTCEYITGVPTLSLEDVADQAVLRPRMAKWRRKAAEERVAKKQQAPTVPVVAAVVEPPVVKPVVAKVAVPTPAQRAVVASSVCFPDTFEVRSWSKDELKLYAKDGATAWQLIHSCYAKVYDVSAVAVVTGNTAEKTVPYCTKDTGKPEFDTKRLRLFNREGGVSYGEPANQDFVEKCGEQRLGYALQPRQVLTLRAKGTAIPATQVQQLPVSPQVNEEPVAQAMEPVAPIAPVETPPVPAVNIPAALTPVSMANAPVVHNALQEQLIQARASEERLQTLNAILGCGILLFAGLNMVLFTKLRDRARVSLIQAQPTGTGATKPPPADPARAEVTVIVRNESKSSVKVETVPDSEGSGKVVNLPTRRLNHP